METFIEVSKHRLKKAYNKEEDEEIEETCCSSWLKQASKFKTTGLIDIMQSVITVILVMALKSHLSVQNASGTIPATDFLLEWNGLISNVGLVLIFGMMEMVVMVVVTLLSFIGQGKKIMFCYCFCVCCRENSPGKRDIQLMNLIALVFLVTGFKAILIVFLSFSKDKAIIVKTYMSGVNQDFLKNNTPQAVYTFGQMQEATLLTQEVMSGLIYLHAAYLVLFAAYIVYEGMDRKNKLSEWIARHLCCCCCLPFKDVDLKKEEKKEKKQNKFMELVDKVTK